MDELRPEDPRWIGGYRLLRRLGAGGMGRVYLARSERGRTVAVKLVHGELSAAPEFRVRFRQEIEAARRVGGRWTAPVLDADTEAATPWVATGYVAGPSLHEVVTGPDHGALPERTVRALANGLAQALGDIHGTGLVHRDLKPSNVLITIDGPRVIDFGIARALETVAGDGLTRTGAVIGSPGFMSPEQVRGQRVTPASDVFCLGAVLAFAATGRMPFGDSASGVHALLFRVAQEEPDLDGLPPGPLRDLITDCLAKDPALRPSVPELLHRTHGDLEAGDAWLPGALTAHLGQHAVRLLEIETPADTQVGTPWAAAAATPATPPPAAPVPAPYPARAPIQPGPPGQPGPPIQPGQFGPMVPPGPYGPAAPMGPHTPAPGRTTPLRAVSPRALSTALVLLLSACMLASVANLHHDYGLYRELATMAESASGGSAKSFQERIQGWEDTSAWLLTGLGLTFIAAMVLWLCWFRRVRINAEVFAPAGHRLGRGWAIGSWFIPIAHLWIPKQISNDIWKASAPPSSPGRRRRAAGAPRGVLHAWWALWAAQTAMMYFSTSWQTWTEAETVAQARFITGISLTAQVLGLASAVLAVVMVQTLTSMQERRIAALSPTGANRTPAP
ncbi:protein kinase domain-containing protein [Streptomyces sp. PR69]|uniref:protein kinase domain-containing protein n=1 Tax=Streptomyces sp. PR69 TaxID=2984950 RepID=UPI002263CB57|nr:DUF4328 domain-containing protein [Streptomyces sp. PR69]